MKVWGAKKCLSGAVALACVAVTLPVLSYADSGAQRSRQEAWSASPPAAAPDFENARARRDRLRAVLNEESRGEKILPIRQLVGLNQQYRGRRIQWVMMNARTAAGRGTAELLVNGAVVGYPQRVGVVNQRYIFQLDPYRNIVGRDVRTLQLRIRGNFTVKAVAVQLAPEYGEPGYPPVVTPPSPYPPAYPPAVGRYTCELYSYYGDFAGQGPSSEIAADRARENCRRTVHNPEVCRSGSVSCWVR